MAAQEVARSTPQLFIGKELVPAHRQVADRWDIAHYISPVAEMEVQNAEGGQHTAAMEGEHSRVQTPVERVIVPVGARCSW